MGNGWEFRFVCVFSPLFVWGFFSDTFSQRSNIFTLLPFVTNFYTFFKTIFTTCSHFAHIRVETGRNGAPSTSFPTSKSTILSSTLHTTHHTLHTTHHTSHTTHYTLHTTNYTQHTLHTTHHTLHTTHYTLHPTHHTPHITQHTAHNTCLIKLHVWSNM